MAKFRKKPVVIDAVKFDGTREGVTEIEKFIGSECGFHSRGNVFSMWIDTLEGGHTASPGDWIIRGVAGEYYPCKPGIFEQTYEPAGALSTQEGE